MDSGYGNLVVRVTHSWPACHEFEPSTAEDPPCRGAMLVEFVESSEVLSLVWYGSYKRGCQLRCRLRHLTMVQNDEKNVKSGKGPLTPAGLLKLVKRFEETGKLEDRARTGRPCLKEARAPCIAVEMEAIASEEASGTSSAREAARRLGLPPSSVRNILRRILQLYPYKLQSRHELLPADTAQREAFAKWAFSKMEQDPTWVSNILWTDEKLISRFMMTLITITVAFGRPLIPVNTHRSHCIPQK
ncbi:uncharacterized protein TNCV_4009631 [Trichonephila clavipes]|nr:uncharacterized protein TNCV_4009631 [Trichonephila clavipes]